MATEESRTSDLTPGSSIHSIGLRKIAEGSFAPTDFAVAPGETERKYIVNQPGTILVLEDDTICDDPFLDIRDRVVDLKWGHDERGLLGLAFHPDYEQNRKLYVRYSAPPRHGTPGKWDHSEVLAESEANADGIRADPGTERTILEIPHPHLHHNAGDLVFGPDGYLDFGTGDGGHTGDVGPGHADSGNGQDIIENLMGSILRIDVDAKPTKHPRTDGDAPAEPVGDEGYAIPDNNPLVGEAGLDDTRRPFDSPVKYLPTVRGNATPAMCVNSAC